VWWEVDGGKGWGGGGRGGWSLGGWGGEEGGKGGGMEGGEVRREAAWRREGEEDRRGIQREEESWLRVAIILN